jgi:16S rRNA (guanine527-N7)-methyltransferase
VFHVKHRPAQSAARNEGPHGAERLPAPVFVPINSDLERHLNDFLDLLLAWNARINLVATRDPDVIRSRHIADSLQLLPLLPPGSEPIADLGTGGGFPGLILALATSRPVHLVESDRRKAAFLTEAAGRLGLSHVRVHPQRIEAVTIPPLAAITARALAPLTDLLPHALRLLAPGGIAIFPKGRSAEAELTATAPHWQFQVERFASRTDPEATILRLSDLRRASPDA